MSDEQIEELLKKNFQALASAKRNIWSFVIAMVIVIFYVANQIEGDSKVIILLLVIITFVIAMKSIDAFYIKKLRKIWDGIESILKDDCDSKLYFRVVSSAYDNYVQTKMAKLLIATSFLQACMAEGMTDKAKELLSDPFFIERVIAKNPAVGAYINMQIAILDRDSNLMNKYYQKISDMIKNNDENAESIFKMADVDYLFNTGEYQRCLDIIDIIEVDTQYSRVSITYMKGCAFFQLRDYKEAKTNLEYVVEYGNTLPLVERAKEILVEIDK